MELFILGILILLNSFFALSEIALISSKKTRLEQLKLKGSSGAKIALQMLDGPGGFLSAIQVGITLIGIVTGVYGGINIADDVAPIFEGFQYTQQYANQIALTLTVIVITYVSIVIGELVPKTIALSNPESIAVRVAPAIFFFSKAFYPFVKLLSLSTNFINKSLGIKKKNEQVSEAEIRHIIKVASMEGIIEHEEKTIHEKVFYFADKKAKHLMTHRSEIEWIDIGKDGQEILEYLLNAKHSMVICCKGNLDNFQGVLYIKDYFKAYGLNHNVDITKLLVQPIIIPETAVAKKVLKLLRSKKDHMCFVVNEYGDFEGVITLHDIIENIIGEIPEEGERHEPDVFVREDKSVLVNGDAPVEVLIDIFEGFTVDFEEIDYSTVAGFVFTHIDKIPQVGDKFEYLDYTIEIVDMDGNRIDKLLIAKS